MNAGQWDPPESRSVEEVPNHFRRRSKVYFGLQTGSTKFCGNVNHDTKV